MLKKLLFNYYQHYYKDTLGLPNWEELSKNRINEEESERKRMDAFEEKVGTVAGKTLLNIGCGTGGFNVVAHERGAIVYGIDPDEEAIRICRLKAEKYMIPKDRFRLSEAENLPFKSNTFDLINCFTVLEHVDNVQKTLKEMIRVTRPGGKIYINHPNYWRLYEGHYKILWCPIFLIRPIGKLYLHLRKRPTEFLNTLNFIDGTSVSKALKKDTVRITRYQKKIERRAGIIEGIAYFYYHLFHIDSNIETVITKVS